MAEISKSPSRLSFQREAYVARCEEDGKLPNVDYLKMYEEDIKRYDARFDTAQSRKDSMEYDLLTTAWILEKVRASEKYAQNLYAAMCNRGFQKNDTWPVLANQSWGCSWRYAGGIVADMRQEGDYIDWYCSGIKNGASDEELAQASEEDRIRYDWMQKNFVGEGYVTDEIKEDLFKLGWLVLDIDDEE